VIVPPKTYFQEVMKVCRAYDVYMISDEVICGFGRLGTMFGCAALGFEPHSITVAKALTSAYVPMAALTVPEPMYQAMLDESRKIGTFGHGFTYSGHPVAAAVALKALDIYARERIAEQAARKAPHFQARLAAVGKHPLVGEARGLGLVGAVELVADKRSKRSFDAKAGVGRAVRPPRPRARSNLGLGQARTADGSLKRAQKMKRRRAAARRRSQPPRALSS